MPFDLGHLPAFPAPQSCPIAEAGVEPPNIAGWPTDRALEKAGDMALENRGRLEADGVFVALGLQEVIEIRKREGGIALEEQPLHHRLQHHPPPSP